MCPLTWCWWAPLHEVNTGCDAWGPVISGAALRLSLAWSLSGAGQHSSLPRWHQQTRRCCWNTATAAANLLSESSRSVRPADARYNSCEVRVCAAHILLCPGSVGSSRRSFLPLVGIVSLGWFSLQSFVLPLPAWQVLPSAQPRNLLEDFNCCYQSRLSLCCKNSSTLPAQADVCLHGLQCFSKYHCHVFPG